MLMHTKVFGRYEGAEEVMSVTPTYTEINVIGNYAPTAKASVTVVDAGGVPVDSACVEFKLYNYAEFYTVATKYTSASGICGLTAGKGDMLVWASKDGHFGFARLSFGKQSELTVKLDKKEGVPPSDGKASSYAIRLSEFRKGTIPFPTAPIRQPATVRNSLPACPLSFSTTIHLPYVPSFNHFFSSTHVLLPLKSL